MLYIVLMRLTTSARVYGRARLCMSARLSMNVCASYKDIMQLR